MGLLAQDHYEHGMHRASLLGVLVRRPAAIAFCRLADQRGVRRRGVKTVLSAVKLEVASCQPLRFLIPWVSAGCIIVPELSLHFWLRSTQRPDLPLTHSILFGELVSALSPSSFTDCLREEAELQMGDHLQELPTVLRRGARDRSAEHPRRQLW